ncbi:hypothetical protein Q9251_08175 [Alkalihalobacillus macyae]|uniref:hypothetical protein n=1 Tax=Guptibacillus hwajinpoensis TaxID=208199 RepID=UPI00273BA294|nr:hypothetical protein [Alkalihalobacillus macyae]MDP4550859.1 hypothetical protein [Alkalihalobacillus macyae]
MSIVNNKLWRISSENLMGYTEDRDTIKRLKRSYKDFEIVADYFKFGKLIGVQFRVQSHRKRAARHLLGGVFVSDENVALEDENGVG